MQTGKIPPQKIEVESIVLGQLMLNNNALMDNIGFIRPEYFYKEAHQEIFLAIQGLVNASEAVDLLTVTAKLSEMGKLELCGGPFYVTELTNSVASGENLTNHLQILKNCFLKRNLIKLSLDAIQSAYDETTDAIQNINHVENELTSINNIIINNAVDHSPEDITTALNTIINQQGKELMGVESGNEHLDSITGGFNGGDLIIWAGRPGSGKTDRAINVALKARLKGKDAYVTIFNLEMSKTQLWRRALHNVAKVNNNKTRLRKLEESDYVSFRNAEKHLKFEKRISIIDRIENLNFYASILRNQKRKGMLDIAIFDYLQLIEPSEKTGVREQDVSTVSRGLKKLAKELDIPIIALSQLGRKLEERGDKRPILADLRESGAIEQDADMVIMVYRPSYYYSSKEDDRDYRNNENFDDIEYLRVIETLVQKNRNGDTTAIHEYYYPEMHYMHQYYVKDLGPYNSYRDDNGSLELPPI